MVRSITSGFHKHYFRNNSLSLWWFFILSVTSLRQSVEIRTIWALEISNKPGEADPSKPTIRFVAGIHGNAPVGTELLLEFAALLCINYGKNPAITTVSFLQGILLVYTVSLPQRQQIPLREKLILCSRDGRCQYLSTELTS